MRPYKILLWRWRHIVTNEYYGIEPDPEGFIHFREHSPDQHRAELYNRVKQYCDSTANLANDKRLWFSRNLKVWASRNGHTKQELNNMLISVRM